MWVTHPVFDIFSDIFASRENALTRVDPRTKLILTLLLIFCTILSEMVWFPLVVFTCCLVAMALIRIPPGLVLLRLCGPLGIVAVLIVLQMFLSGSTPLVTLHFGPWTLIASKEGLARGILLGSRVLAAVSTVILLGSVTPAHKIFAALRWFKVPEGWVEIAMLVYRYTFSLLDQTSDVLTAQRARLGYSSVKTSLSSVGVVAGTVLIRAMDQAMRTYEAMTLRGYQGSMPFGPLPALGQQDVRILTVGIPVILMAFLFMERYIV
jgi:cobalt/nickel transport system permease protein